MMNEVLSVAGFCVHSMVHCGFKPFTTLNDNWAVEHIPSSEHESVLAHLQFGDVVIGVATRVRPEVVGEVIVKRVSARLLAIDDELHIVSNAVACGVDAVFIHYLCHEVGCAVHFASILERRRIEITVY